MARMHRFRYKTKGTRQQHRSADGRTQRIYSTRAGKLAPVAFPAVPDNLQASLFRFWTTAVLR
jgi:hypothetical protein